ncbi:hypothetical protein D3C72_1885710 [compost metagenome]
MPLGTVFSATGTYNIKLQTPEGIFGKNQNIYLRDKLLNRHINLSDESGYEFYAVKGAEATRFEIAYLDDSTVLGSANAGRSYFEVYRDGNSFVLKSTNILGEIAMYDFGGRLLRSYQSKSTSFRIDAGLLPSGIYIIKAENGGDVRTKKVVR